MPLPEIIVPRAEVAVGDATFEVRGLNFNDLAYLAVAHYQPLAALYQRLSEGPAGSAAANLLEVEPKQLAEAIFTAPALVASVIALAAEDSGEQGVERAAALPMSAQIDAIAEVLRLTLVAEGGVGKLAAVAQQIVQGVAAMTPRGT